LIEWVFISFNFSQTTNYFRSSNAQKTLNN
jgi:hypothetical protein